jgi:hypothetical protein
MVALDKKVDAYTSDEFVEISDTGSKRSRYAFAPTPSKKWKSTELEAA